MRAAEVFSRLSVLHSARDLLRAISPADPLVVTFSHIVRGLLRTAVQYVHYANEEFDSCLYHLTNRKRVCGGYFYDQYFGDTRQTVLFFLKPCRKNKRTRVRTIGFAVSLCMYRLTGKHGK